MVVKISLPFLLQIRRWATYSAPAKDRSWQLKVSQVFGRINFQPPLIKGRQKMNTEHHQAQDFCRICSWILCKSNKSGKIPIHFSHGHGFPYILPYWPQKIFPSRKADLHTKATCIKLRSCFDGPMDPESNNKCHKPPVNQYVFIRKSNGNHEGCRMEVKIRHINAYRQRDITSYHSYPNWVNLLAYTVYCANLIWKHLYCN